MKLSLAVSNILQAFKSPSQDKQQRPLEFLRGIFKQIMRYSAVRNISGCKRFGKTDPLWGERLLKKQREDSLRAKENQFPVKIKLPDGRHRYFKKDGVLVDRLAV